MSSDFMSGSVAATSDVLVQEFGDGDAVLLHLRTEQYFGLDGVGLGMWSALTSTARIVDAYEQLLNEYDVEPETLQRDLEELMEKLVERELLEISPG